MKTRIAPTIWSTLIALVLCAAPLRAAAQGTAFMYQGRLNDNGAPANGSYDLTFALFDSASAGAQHGETRTNLATAVSNGLFSVTLDFGNQFDGNPRWLQIGVRTNGAGAFTTLAPRQAILAAPYSIMAGSASNATYAINAGAAMTATAVGSVSAGNVAQLNVPNTTIPATGTVTVVSGFIVAAKLLNGGSGYTTTPAVSVLDASGSNAVVTAAVSNGVVTALNVQSAGIHYSSSATLLIAPPPSNAVQTFGSINNFTGLNNFSGILNANNLYLPATTTTAGVIYSGGNPFIYGGAASIFAGYMAGNFSSSVSNLASSWNVGLGDHALAGLTTGFSDTAVGSQALMDDTAGNRNTAIGRSTMVLNTTGNQNVAVGFSALFNNSTASYNTAVGAHALSGNTTGWANEAIGQNAMVHNAGGQQNAALGDWALFSNISGSQNTADGSGVLQANTTGGSNTGIGFHALYSNTNGNDNIAMGRAALFANVASDNTALGYFASDSNTTGSNNVAGGAWALHSNSTGYGNIALGFQAGDNVTGNNNIEIGNEGAANDNGVIRIGTPGAQTIAFIAGTVYGDGGGLTNLPAGSIQGGLTTNLPVLVAGGLTNILCFTNGVLMTIK